MDFNTLLTRFGFDSSNFVNKPLEAIKTNNGIIYEAKEAYKERMAAYIKGIRKYRLKEAANVESKKKADRIGGGAL